MTVPLELLPGPQPPRWRWCTGNDHMIPGGFVATDWCGVLRGEVVLFPAKTLEEWQHRALDAEDVVTDG